MMVCLTLLTDHGCLSVGMSKGMSFFDALNIKLLSWNVFWAACRKFASFWVIGCSASGWLSDSFS